MAFTSSIFLFVFFPICLLGFFLAHAVEKVGPVFKKLRLSDLFLVGIGLIFYGWASLDGIFWMVGMISGFPAGKTHRKGSPENTCQTACSAVQRPCGNTSPDLL